MINLRQKVDRLRKGNCRSLSIWFSMNRREVANIFRINKLKNKFRWLSKGSLMRWNQNDFGECLS